MLVSLHHAFHFGLFDCECMEKREISPMLKREKKYTSCSTLEKRGPFLTWYRVLHIFVFFEIVLKSSPEILDLQTLAPTTTERGLLRDKKVGWSTYHYTIKSRFKFSFIGI